MIALAAAAIAILLALLTLAAALFARRAWLASSALERQVMETRAQLAEARDEDKKHWQNALAAGGRLETRFAALQDELRELLHAGARESSRLLDVLGELTHSENRTSAAVAESSRKLAIVAGGVEAFTRKPLESFPIDTGRLEGRTEREVIALAESVATLRPLVPYPKWRFDADWANPDLAFLLRQRLWQYFHDRKLDTPVVTRWHGGTRLRLFLGNDLSRQIFIAGCMDPNEFAFLDRYLQPGMTFVDAGANEGAYTIFAAARVGPAGRVWAFEPSRRELTRLEANLELNRLTARVCALALAECTGKGELTVSGFGHEGLNTLGAFAYEGIEVAGKHSVELKSLDEVLDQDPPARLDALKIDVEGAELRLLRGAREALRRYRPVLLLEVSEASLRHQGSSREELLDYLRAQEFVPHFFDPYTGMPSPATPGIYSDNMIAAPSGTSFPDSVYSPWPSR